MVVEMKSRGFVCTTAHPAGCAANVAAQIDYVRGQPRFTGVKNALIIGCSTGYGLSTRVAASFGAGAATLGVAYERPASRMRTATAGWYNTAAFERAAQKDGLYAQTIIGDAFSDEIKAQVISRIKEDLGKVDLVVYSLAAPRRTYGGVTYHSTLKPVGHLFSSKSIDLGKMEVTDVTLEPASEEEINGTVKVMGGEDWLLWMRALREAGALAPDAVTVAYSYIGPQLTFPIYHDGTVGLAKQNLAAAAAAINADFASLGTRAFISVNKAVVTQASAAIPVVPLYISLLFKVMKARGTHEDTVQQMYRMLVKKLYQPTPETDAEGQLRLDDWEMDETVQRQVGEAWATLNNDTLRGCADLEGYRADFHRLFGFGLAGVDYAADVETEINIPSIPAE